MAASTRAWRPSRASASSLLGGPGGDQLGLDLGDALGGRAVDGGLEVLPGLGLGPRAGVGELGLEAAALGGELLEPVGDAGELLEQGVGGHEDPLRLRRVDLEAEGVQGVGEGGDEVVLAGRMGRATAQLAQRALEVLTLVGDGRAGLEEHGDGLDLDVLELVEQGVVVGIVVEGGGDLAPRRLGGVQLGLGRARGGPWPARRRP